MEPKKIQQELVDFMTAHLEKQEFIQKEAKFYQENKKL